MYPDSRNIYIVEVIRWNSWVTNRYTNEKREAEFMKLHKLTCSTTWPSLITAILSAFLMVESRWATMMVVRPFLALSTCNMKVSYSMCYIKDTWRWKVHWKQPTTTQNINWCFQIIRDDTLTAIAMGRFIFLWQNLNAHKTTQPIKSLVNKPFALRIQGCRCFIQQQDFNVISTY